MKKSSEHTEVFESLRDAAARLLERIEQRAKKQVAAVPAKDAAEILDIGARPCVDEREGSAASGYARFPQFTRRREGKVRRDAVLQADNDNVRFGRADLMMDFPLLGFPAVTARPIIPDASTGYRPCAILTRRTPGD